MMNKIISYPLSIVAYALFFLVLCLFHPAQYLCFNLLGYNAHKKCVDLLNFCLLRILWITFSTAKIEMKADLPEDRPIIFVANHQGLYDIIGIGWFLRKYHPKYVSKVELGRGIPSVSYNLNHGGSVLIDRKDPKQALPALKKMAEYIEANHRSTVIYPEGTRSKNGKPRSFASNGVKILCKYAPNALVVPVSINDSWKVFRYGPFPLGIGNHLTFTVHPPIEVKENDFSSLFEQTEKAVVEGIRLG
jgi:1-acyl-sn-glycerol-3-phosphate acyltransferase